MPLQLQFSLLTASILVFILILRNIKKSKLSTDLATVWILWGAGLIVISLFPQIVGLVGSIIGIIAPINTVFLVMFFLLYVLVFFLYIKVSLLEERVKNLVHAVALMNKDERHE